MQIRIMLILESKIFSVKEKKHEDKTKVKKKP